MKSNRKVQAIIYAIKKRIPYYLILHRVLHWSGWELLKETIENDETHEETMIRGIEEETSLKKYKIIKSFDVKIKFGENIIEKVFVLKQVWMKK